MDKYEEAKQLWYDTVGVQANITDWGIHLNDEYSGVNGFNWLKDEKELMRLVRLFPYSLPVDEDTADDPIYQNQIEESAACLNELMDCVERRQLTWSEARAKFKSCDTGYEVLWWGPFEDILTSEMEGAVWAREGFWADQSGENEQEEEMEDNAKPIPPDMLNEFAEWLSNWA